MNQLTLTLIFLFACIISAYAKEQPQAQLQASTTQTAPAALVVSKVKHTRQNNALSHEPKPLNNRARFYSIMSIVSLLAVYLLMLLTAVVDSAMGGMVIIVLACTLLTLSIIFGIVSLVQKKRSAANIFLSLISVMISSAVWGLFLILATGV